MKRIYLDYLPQHKAFGITDKDIALMEQENIIPDLRLGSEAYRLLNCEKPHFFGPIIGFLMEREKEQYTAS